MCKIGKTIKFCTCLNEQEISPENSNYWVLFRYNEKKELHIIGEIILPDYDINLEQIRMRSRLLEAISDQSNFDTPMCFRERDRLQIIFNNQTKDVIYDFEFCNGVWQEIEDPDSFSLVNNFDEVAFGMVENK